MMLTVPWASAQVDGDDVDDAYAPSDDDDQKTQVTPADDVADQSPQLPSGPQLLQQPAAAPLTPLRLAAAPTTAPAEAEAKIDATTAKNAAKVARQAAKVADKVAEHSVKITGHAKKALKHALGALHDARIDSAGLAKHQKESLKKAEAHLREATKDAEYGKLKKVKDTQDLQKEKMEKDLEKNKGKSEKEQMREEIQELRKKLKEKKVDDKEIDKALDDLESDIEKTDGPINDESKAELERLRQLVDSLDAPEDNSKDAKVRKAQKVEEPDMEPLKKEEGDGKDGVADGQAVPVQAKGFDIDTAMPYGDLEPFGREDTAQELTESSIAQSDEMVDQLERAEVAEEKRAVFRALTRLRGAAITSFDGVARSQTGNMDEFNKVHKWRTTHPLHHLADEESDVSKWAFPDNAD
jgi:hypothetical protein